MGKITEIKSSKKKAIEQQKEVVPRPDHHDDAASDVSDDDHEAIQQETLQERLRALRDIFPEHKRNEVSQQLQSFKSGVWRICKLVGSTAWILSTSAIVLVLPLMISMEKDQQITMWEQEQQMQQQQAQKV